MRHLFAATLVIACAAIAGAEAPPRTAGGGALVVPDEHRALGEVYFVERGRDVQVTFTSDAPIERVVGTSGEVVGYAVLATDPTAADSPLLAGAFRLPVESFETGIPMRNEHLRSDRWMDAPAHPDVHFVLEAFENASVTKRDDAKGFVTWEGDLVGAMTIKGATREVRIPAAISLLDLGENRAARGGGKKLALRCRYTVNLGDYDIATDEPSIAAGRMADEITIDQFLLLSPNDPDAPRPGRRPAGG